MRILLAPDKFKGSMTALEAATAMERGLSEGWPGCETSICPIADGGEGTAEALCAALQGEWVEVTAQDPMRREVSCRYAWIEKVPDGPLAVIEMSEASGMKRLRPGEQVPMQATSLGTGQLIAHAAEKGAQRILVGLGGSATNDGGAGLAQALGYRFLNFARREVFPFPQNFHQIESIAPPPQPISAEIVVACDVKNPLLGAQGATTVYGPQKGVHDVAAMEQRMERYAQLVEAHFGKAFCNVPGAGAAGGLGFGLTAFAGTRLTPGFDLIAQWTQLEEKVAQSDMVFTGEGLLDGQSLEGKAPVGIAQLAARHGVPCVALCGSIVADAEMEARLREVFAGYFSIVDSVTTLNDALAQGSQALERASARMGHCLRNILNSPILK